MSNGEIYKPKTAAESFHYEYLWKVASPDNKEIGGAPAVGFFRQSGIDGGFLKQIWGLSTPAASMNHDQFFVALRYITMVQGGEFPITKDRFLKTANEALGLPKFNNLNIPVYQPPPAAVTPQAVQKSFPPNNQGGGMMMTGSSTIVSD